MLPIFVSPGRHAPRSASLARPNRDEGRAFRQECHDALGTRRLFFTEKLQFILVNDTVIGADKRWVLVAPAGAPGASLLPARAATEERSRLVGNQGAGRVFLFLHTDDFRRDYEGMRARGVTFLETPRTEAYGSVTVFQDLYGNKWDLPGPG